MKTTQDYINRAIEVGMARFGLTQKSLADLLHIDRMTINARFTNKRAWDVTALDSIAQHIGYGDGFGLYAAAAAEREREIHS